MNVVAEISPVTTPVTGSTLAKNGLLLLHVPPGTVSDNAVVEPTHSCNIPDIGAGNGSTVIPNVAVQFKGDV